MNTNKIIQLDRSDLLRVEQIVLDNDREEALIFIKEVIKKSIDREDNSRMRREKT